MENYTDIQVKQVILVGQERRHQHDILSLDSELSKLRYKLI